MKNKHSLYVPGSGSPEVQSPTGNYLFKVDKGLIGADNKVNSLTCVLVV